MAFRNISWLLLGESQNCQRRMLSFGLDWGESFMLADYSAYMQTEKLSLKDYLYQAESLVTRLGFDCGEAYDLSYLGERSLSKFKVFIFLSPTCWQFQRLPSESVKFLPLKYLQLDVSCYGVHFLSIRLSRTALPSAVLAMSTSLLRKRCEAKTMNNYSTDLFQSILVMRLTLHSTVRQLTKMESPYLSSLCWMQGSSLESQFLKGRAWMYLKASCLSCCWGGLSSRRERTTKGALSQEQKQRIQTTKWMIWEIVYCGAAEMTVAQTKETTSQTPVCCILKVRMPSNSLSSKLQEVHSSEKYYRVSALC